MFQIIKGWLVLGLVLVIVLVIQAFGGRQLWSLPFLLVWIALLAVALILDVNFIVSWKISSKLAQFARQQQDRRPILGFLVGIFSLVPIIWAAFCLATVAWIACYALVRIAIPTSSDETNLELVNLIFGVLLVGSITIHATRWYIRNRRNQVVV